MLLDKTIGENLDGKYLIAHADQFNENIEYAQEVKIPQIQLSNLYGKDNINIIDFKLLESLSDHLRILHFSDELNHIINLESIYSLKNLEKIYIGKKQKFILDVSMFPKLQYLGGEYWNELVNIGKAYSLTGLLLTKLKDIDLKQFSELRQLRVLHIYGSKIKTLDGIDNLPIQELSLAYNAFLEDIESIKHLSCLKKLCIERCKRLDTSHLVESIGDRVQIQVIG